MAADIPELRSWVQHVAQTIRRVYVQALEGRSVYGWYSTWCFLTPV